MRSAALALMLPHTPSDRSDEHAADTPAAGEDPMTRAQYGWIATMTGAAMAATWWWRRRDSVARGMSEAGHDRGELIFSNTPMISER